MLTILFLDPMLTKRYIDGTNYSPQSVLNSLSNLPRYQSASLLLQRSVQQLYNMHTSNHIML